MGGERVSGVAREMKRQPPPGGDGGMVRHAPNPGRLSPRWRARRDSVAGRLRPGARRPAGLLSWELFGLAIAGGALSSPGTSRAARPCPPPRSRSRAASNT